MKLINFIIVITISCGVGFLNYIFFIGTMEGMEKLKENIITAFPLRFIFFSVVGIIALLPLCLLNLLVNKIKVNEIDIKKLLTFGTIAVSVGSFVGTIFFFYGN